MNKVMENFLNTKSLSEEAAKELLLSMLNGELNDEQISAVLAVLRHRGETADEIAGFAKGMKESALEVTPPFPVLDTCGTGGDGSGTYNISTGAAILLSSLGVPVAKHGNRSVSSKTGSADVLDYLGISIQAKEEEAIEKLKTDNLCFLYAPIYHSAMKEVAKARKQLGVKTIFNLLGPLTNPAGASRRLIGVYSRHAAVKMARAAIKLGVERAMFVTGDDGLDEITITGKTYVYEIQRGRLTEYLFSPEDAGLNRGDIKPALVETAEESGKMIESVLKGEGPEEAENILLLNAGAALYVYGAVSSIAEGVHAAKEALGNKAFSQLEKLRNAGKGVLVQ
ncbi:anthranilate phosphoribosyltransferase [Evansella clarkii]|jgi:anthranilate phosphoribosyltransferase|uniref:anthranilate phosphoribosyltransferase n=1 Tax=Evansella clarkii TaxID=79879 RepID=UPI000997416F|nr:anthranilate phosphoribosyltransferase [Evansella clarkii]